MNGKPQQDSVCTGMAQIRVYKCFKPISYWLVMRLTTPAKELPDVVKVQIEPHYAPDIAAEYGISILHREKPDF